LAEAFATSEITAMHEAMTTLTELANESISLTTFGVETAEPPGERSLPSGPTKPTFRSIAANFPVLFDAFSGAALADLSMPEWDGEKPIISFKDAPDVVYPDEPGNAPTVAEIETPDAPVLVFPDAPNFSEIVIEDAPEIDEAFFEGVRPALSLTPPGKLLVVTPPETFRDVLLDKFRAKIATIIETGSPMSDKARNALFSRGRNKIDEAAATEEAALHRRFASLGWSRPPGALNALVAQTRGRYAQSLTDLLKDILVEEERLIQSNTQVGLQYGMVVVQAAIDLRNKDVELSWEQAKTFAEFTLKEYEAALSYHKAELEQYQADAVVFKARVDAKIQRLEQYKAYLEGKRITADVQAKLIEIYKAELSGLELRVNIFNAQMSAAKIKAELQRQILDNYKTTVEAYSTRLQSIATRYDAYIKSIAGEEAKVNLYSKEVAAYGTLVDAKARKGSYDIERRRLEIAEWETKAKRHASALTQAEAELKALLAENENLTKIFTSEVGAFEAETKAITSLQSVDVEQYKAKVQENTQRAQALMAQAKNLVDAYMAQQALREKIAEIRGSTHAHVSTAALGSRNATVGFDYKSNDSFSVQNSFHGGVTVGESWTHQFQESS
jgi:hypothetical protein